MKKKLGFAFVLAFSMNAAALTIECPTSLPVQGTSHATPSGWQARNGGALNAGLIQPAITAWGMRCIYQRSGGDMILERALVPTQCSASGATINCTVAMTCPQAAIMGSVFPAAPNGWSGHPGGAAPATFFQVRVGGPGVQCVYTAPSLTVTLDRPFPGGQPCGIYGNGFICP